MLSLKYPPISAKPSLLRNLFANHASHVTGMWQLRTDSTSVRKHQSRMQEIRSTLPSSSARTCGPRNRRAGDVKGLNYTSDKNQAAIAYLRCK